MPLQYDYRFLFRDADKLLRGQETVEVGILNGMDVVGLFFASKCSLSSRNVTSILSNMYNVLKENDKSTSIEIVFLSFDSLESTFLKYYEKMPWLALPHRYCNLSHALAEQFGCKSIPYLVLLNGKTGAEITRDGFDTVFYRGIEGLPYESEYISECILNAKRERRQSILSVFSGWKIFHDDTIASELEKKEAVAILFSRPGHDHSFDYRERFALVYESLSDRMAVVYITCCDDSLTGIPSSWIIPQHIALKGHGDYGLYVISGNSSDLLTEIKYGEIYSLHASDFPWSTGSNTEAAKLAAIKMKINTPGLKYLEGVQLVAHDIGNSLRRVEGSSAEFLSQFELVGFYFSDHRHSWCNDFTPKLTETYRRLKEMKKNVEVVFVSSDENEKSFKRSFADMPWLAIDYKQYELSELLKLAFGAKRPILVWVTPETGEVNLEGEVDLDGYPWTTAAKMQRMRSFRRDPIHLGLSDGMSGDDDWREYTISKKCNGNRVLYTVMNDGTCKEMKNFQAILLHRKSSSHIGYIDGELFKLATGLNILVILDFLSLSSDDEFQPSPSLLERTAAASVLLNSASIKLPSNICTCISKRPLCLNSITQSFFDDFVVDDSIGSMFDGLILESDTDDSKCFKLKWGKFLTADVCIGQLIKNEDSGSSKLFEALVIDDHSSNDIVKSTYPVLMSEAMQTYMAQDPNKRHVFECFLDITVKHWVAIKLRPDRTKPNYISDVERITEHSFNNKSLPQIIEKLLSMKKPYNDSSAPRKMEPVITKYVRYSAFEYQEIPCPVFLPPLQVLLVDHSEISPLHRLTTRKNFGKILNDDVNGPPASSDVTALKSKDNFLDGIFSYHRAVKRFLYTLFKGKCVIDVGSGTCLDAYVWLKNGSTILAIDKDGLKVMKAYAMLSGKLGLYKSSRGFGHRIAIMHADATQPGLRSEITANLKWIGARNLAHCCCAFFSLQGVLGSLRSLDVFLDNILPNMKMSSYVVALLLDGDEFTALLETEGGNEVLVLSDDGSHPLFRLSLIDNKTESWLGGGYISFQRNDSQPVAEVLIHGIEDFSSPLHRAMKARDLRVERVCTLASFMTFLPAAEQDLYLKACDRHRQISKLYKCVIWYREGHGNNDGLASVSNNAEKKAGHYSLLSLPSDITRNLLQYLNVPTLFTLASISASWLEFLTCAAVNICDLGYLHSKSFLHHLTSVRSVFIYCTMDNDEDDISLTHEADLIAIRERISWERAQPKNWTEDNTCLNCGILIGNHGLPGYCGYECCDSTKMSTDNIDRENDISLTHEADLIAIKERISWERAQPKNWTEDNTCLNCGILIGNHGLPGYCGYECWDSTDFKKMVRKCLTPMLFRAMLLSVKPNLKGAVSTASRDVRLLPSMKFPRLYELFSKSTNYEFRAILKCIIDKIDTLPHICCGCNKNMGRHHKYLAKDYDSLCGPCGYDSDHERY